MIITSLSRQARPSCYPVEHSEADHVLLRCRLGETETVLDHVGTSYLAYLPSAGRRRVRRWSRVAERVTGWLRVGGGALMVTPPKAARVAAGWSQPQVIERIVPSSRASWRAAAGGEHHAVAAVPLGKRPPTSLRVRPLGVLRRRPASRRTTGLPPSATAGTRQRRQQD